MDSWASEIKQDETGEVVIGNANINVGYFSRL